MTRAEIVAALDRGELLSVLAAAEVGRVPLAAVLDALAARRGWLWRLLFWWR